MCKLTLFLPLLLLIPTPAIAATCPREAEKWEERYQIASFLDGVQTSILLHEGKRELNPFYGSSRPSTERVMGTKLVMGAIHWIAFQEVCKRDPRLASTLSKISLGMQGSILAFNMRLVF